MSEGFCTEWALILALEAAIIKAPSEPKIGAEKLMLQLLLLLRLLLFCFFSCCCCGYLSNHCASRLTMTADGSDGGSWNPRRVVCTIAFAEPRDCVCGRCRRVLSGIRSILMRCHGQILRLALQSHLNLCNGERTKSNWVCRGFCHHWRMR